MAQQDEYEDDYFLEEDKMLGKHFPHSMSNEIIAFPFISCL